jgi:hypothetical protein
MLGHSCLTPGDGSTLSAQALIAEDVAAGAIQGFDEILGAS